MINKLIDKYKKELEELETMKTGYVAYYGERTKCKEFIQDLEKLKKHQLHNLNEVKSYLMSQKATQEMIAMAIRKIEISILGVDTDE